MFQAQKFSVTLIALIMFTACTAEPDGDGGLCSLNCDGATLAPPEFVIEPALQLDNIECPPNPALYSGEGGFYKPGAVAVVRYKIYAKKKNSAGEDYQAFKAGISFNPIVGGLFDPDVNPGNTDSKYRGVKTPVSDWCSDQCGVASVEVVPVCQLAADNNMTVVIQSAANFSPVVNFSYLKPQIEDSSNAGD